MKYFSLVIRILIASIFIYSGWEKLMSPVENFAAVIGEYRFVPSGFIVPVALIFPWLELIFGVFLALGYLTRFSAGIIALFFAAFIFLLSRSLILHLPINECGCFGSALSLHPKQALMLDLSMFLLNIVNIWRPSRWLSLDERLAQ